ncbi:MAG: hypothetical protein FWC89_03925 [Defluviitaleaceae bacterium]|nr:hypothetical protein [Defluviitaleaceae bacterium]
MKTMKKRKIIIIVSLALVMALGVVTTYSFNTSTEVLAVEPRLSIEETLFDWEAFQQTIIYEMQDMFSYRFPNGDIADFDFGVNFNGSFNRANENLEIYLLNASLRIVSRTDELDEILLRRRSPLVTLSLDDRRIFVESNVVGAVAHALATSSHENSTVRTVYFWDNDTAYDALVTIYVPIHDGWIFERANIHIENGNLEIDNDVMEVLANVISITGNVTTNIGFNEANRISDFEQDIHLISEDFSFEIPYIKEGMVVLIGRIELGSNNSYRWTISTEGGSTNHFIGLNESPNIVTFSNNTTPWRQSIGGGSMPNSGRFIGRHLESAYVYVGSMRGNLTNVTGRIVVDN